jgi:hypothetical protein
MHEGSFEEAASAMSAMRPSMMTLVSRILRSSSAAGGGPPEEGAAGAPVEFAALVGADDDAAVGHPEQQHDLEKRDGIAVGGEGLGEDEGHEIGAEDGQDAADGGAEEAGRGVGGCGVRRRR